MTPRVRQIQMAWHPEGGHKRPMIVGIDEDGQTMWFWDWVSTEWVVLDKIDKERE